MPVAKEAIVLAGGFGTRLRSVVSNVPKPLAPVRGRPFLAYVLDLLASNDIHRVILATGYMGDVIVDSVGDRWLGMEVRYSHEEAPLGTGGAIAQAASYIERDAFFVVNGDTYVELDYAAFDMCVDDERAILGMALAHVPDVTRYGSVNVASGRVTGFVEKGAGGAGYINAGVYRLTRSLLKDLPQNHSYSFETDILVPAVERCSVVPFMRTAGFIDIGVPEDYQRAQLELCGKDDRKR